MTEPTARPGPDALAPARGGLLSPFLRRDLADLNALYLDLGLSSVADGDPRFAWSTAVRQCLLAADTCTLARVAAVPFALFELVLPTDACAAPTGRVEDSRSSARLEPWPGCCESFAHQAAFLARRLVDAEPLASRVLLGLSADAQAWLAECRLSQLAELAVNPHMIRPRWRLHERYWEMLIGAARRASPAALQWAHCVGLCLIGTDGEGTVPQPPRRRARR